MPPIYIVYTRGTVEVRGGTGPVSVMCGHHATATGRTPGVNGMRPVRWISRRRAALSQSNQRSHPPPDQKKTASPIDGLTVVDLPGIAGKFGDLIRS